jgi:hypothetical protein
MALGTKRDLIDRFVVVAGGWILSFWNGHLPPRPGHEILRRPGRPPLDPSIKNPDPSVRSGEPQVGLSQDQGKLLKLGMAARPA